MRLQFLILNAFKARKQTVRNIHSSIVSKLKVQKGSNSVRSGLVLCAVRRFIWSIALESINT